MTKKGKLSSSIVSSMPLTVTSGGLSADRSDLIIGMEPADEQGDIGIKLPSETGKFIVVEGLEGAGKTTAIQTIRDYLEPKIQSLVLTREPGGTHVGEVVRSLIKEHIPGEPLNERAELLLLYAARMQHITQVIQPALNQGNWVLSDRFELSTIAYQGGGRQISLDLIHQLSTICLQGFEPDITFFLDVTPQLGLQRVNERGHSDRIESESLNFFTRVYDQYHQSITQMKNIIVIDASKPLPLVQRAIIDNLNRVFV